MGLVELDPQRQGEGPPALVLPMPLQGRDAGVVVDRRIGIGRLIAVLGGIVSARAMHLPQALGLVVIGRQVRELDRPCRRDPSGVGRLLEVAVAQPHQGRAIEGGVAAHPIVGVGRERLAGLVVPALLGAIAMLDEHRLGVPVLGLARQVLAPLQDQNRLAGGRQPLGDGPAPRARADDHHVEMGGQGSVLHTVFGAAEADRGR